MVKFIEEDLPLFIIVFGLLGFFVFKIWLPHCEIDTVLRQEISSAEGELDRNHRQYESLKNQIRELDNNPDYIEKIAVHEHGYTLRGSLTRE